MARKNKKYTNCTPDNVVSMINSLGGFEVQDKKRGPHIKIKHTATGCSFPVPRKNKVNSHIMDDLISKFLVECGFDPEKVCKKLKC